MKTQEAQEVLENNLVYLATSFEDKPNVTVVGAGKFISDDQYLLVDCQMELAKDNMLKNPNCALISFDDKKEIGYKIVGKISYEQKGENFDKAVKHIEGEPYTAKGAIVIKIEKLIKIQ